MPPAGNKELRVRPEMTCFWAKALGQELGPAHSTGYWRAQQELDPEWPVPSCLPKEKPQGCVRERQLGGAQCCQAYAETPNRPPTEGTSRGECEVPETRRAVPGSVHVQGPHTRTSSSLGGASLPGPPASCSLCSRAASSPTGLRWAWVGSCSYPTHRLPSASSVSRAAGSPVGAWVWGPPGGRAGQSRCPQQQSVIRPSGPPVFCKQPPAQPCQPATRTCGCPPQAGDVHIQTLGFPGGEGPGRHGRDSSFSLAQARGSSQGGRHRHLESHMLVGGHLAPPQGGLKASQLGFGDSLFSGQHGRTGPRLG